MTRPDKTRYCFYTQKFIATGLDKTGHDLTRHDKTGQDKNPFERNKPMKPQPQFSTEPLSIGERSQQTQALVQLFSKAQRGAVITWESIQRATGERDRRNLRARITSARHMVQRDYGLVFENVHNVGYKCLSDRGIIDKTATSVKRIGRAAKRSQESLNKIADWDNMSLQDKHDALTASAQLGVVRLAASNGGRKQLKEYVEISNNEIDIGRSLELLK